MSVVNQRSAGSPFSLLKQLTSRDRARRRREFVRQRCRLYGWEPFGVDETQTKVDIDQDDDDQDMELTADITAGTFIYFFICLFYFVCLFVVALLRAKRTSYLYKYFTNSCMNVLWIRNCSTYSEPMTSHALGRLAGSSDQPADVTIFLKTVTPTKTTTTRYGTSTW